LEDGVGSLEAITMLAKKLLEATDLEDVRIRLLGISISNFHDLKLRKDEPPSDQLTLEL